MQTKTDEILKNSRRVHFVGIGGSGMFPLAQILKEEGYTVTGSDVNESSIVELERGMGIDVRIGHDAKNAEGADALVVTAALLAGNPEVAYAEKNNIPIIERADLLGRTSRVFDRSYCISGTHGKTTASSILTSIFVTAGLDPGAVIGGKLPIIGGYGRRGAGRLAVIEACEFKDTFLRLSPAYAVILNVDADHLDYFGTLDGVKSSFSRFAKLAERGVVANGDDKNTLDALDGLGVNAVLFGEGEGCDYKISDVRVGERARFSFTLTAPDGKSGRIALKIPGRHNVYNAAAAAVCALIEGLSFEDVARGVESFAGAGRRFEILGEFGGVTFADDYAHHPAELKVTLAAARAMGYNRVIAVFQPFTYSRTRLLLNEFAEVLSAADITVLSDIMGSREVNTFGVSSEDLAALIDGCRVFHSFDGICDFCLGEAKAGDLVITLGCGDIYKAANEMVRRCRTQKQ